MPTDQRFVIVGAGLAGAKAAETLREQGFDGRLILIGDEPERPVRAPAPLQGVPARGEDREVPYVHEASFYPDNAIEVLTSTRVSGIDLGLRELLLEGDRRLGYDRLLVTTGVGPAPSRRRGRTARGHPLPAHGCRLEPASARGSSRATAGGRRLRLDRSRDRRLGPREGLRGDDDRDGLAAARARPRPRGRPRSTSTSIETTASSSSPRRRSIASRAATRWSA